MMESLQKLFEKLYSNEYFGIGLFIVVTILAFSFLIILFFGKKDQKNRENEEQKDLNKINNVQSEITIDNMDLTSDKTSPDNSMEIQVEEKPIEDVKNDFNPFANTITFDEREMSNNLEDQKSVANLEMNDQPLSMLNFEETNDLDIFNPINTVNEEKPVIEEEPVPNIFQNDLALNLEKNNEFKDESTQVIPKVRPPYPNQFSSVYVNKNNVETENVLESTPAIDLPPQEDDIKPIKPEFELPKTLDLPKLNKEPSNNASSGMISNSGINSIISNIENESFEIKKENDD